MWTRRELKENAKTVLRGIYWKAFLISIVISLAQGGGSGSIRWGGNNTGYKDYNNYNNYGFNHTSPLYSMIIPFVIAFIAVILVVILLAIVARVLIGFPLEVGGRKYFIQSAQYKDNKKCFSFAFNGRNYFGIVITMLVKAIFNFLWYLLLIIPGIVKAYAYRMVPYILADNPNIGAQKAIDLSNKMTKGHKFEMFVLDLSFIGWYLLGVLALIVGVLFVKPYEDATKAELYLVLRRNALENNWCTYEDLALYYPELGEDNRLY